MQWTELDDLVLDNWADLDAATARVQQIEDASWEAFYEVVAEWCRERAWIGAFVPDGQLWFAPPSWSLGGKRASADVSFRLEVGHGDNEDHTAGDDYWWLTRLIRSGRGIVGFRLHQRRRTKVEWSNIVRSNAHAAELSAFTLDDTPSLYLPVEVKKEALAEALRDNDFAEAFGPVLQALDKLEAIVPLVERWLGARQNEA